MNEAEANMETALNNYIEQLHARNLVLLKNIDEVENSLLWKLTLPLRIIENTFRILIRRSRIRKVRI